MEKMIKMPVLSLDPRTFMQPKLIEGIVNREVTPKLNFIDKFPMVFTDATSVSYGIDDVSASDDITSGVQGVPLDMGELSGLTGIEVSPIDRKHGALREFGYEIKVSERDLERNDVIDDLNRAVSRASYGIAKKINGDIVNTLKTVVNDITEPDGNAVWNHADATPVSDITKFIDAMDLENTECELSDLFLNKTNYYEMLDYLQGVDIKWALDPMARNSKTIPGVNGVNIHKLYTSELAEGGYVGIDGTPAFAPITTYAYHPAGLNKDGKFPLIAVNQYQEEARPRPVVTELTAETFHALKVPNACMYKATGI
jgi:hypothetical protein